MAIDWPKVSIGHVPSYMMSGIPYVTSSANNEVHVLSHGTSPIHIAFPFVTRWVSIKNTETGDHNRRLRVGFSANGVMSSGSNVPTIGETDPYITIDIGDYEHTDPILEVMCTDLYFISDYWGVGRAVDFQIIAGLTNIPRDQMYPLTGSNGFEGIG